MVLNLFNKDRIYRQGEKIKGYEIIEILGEGRFGICYQVSCCQKQFILKQLKPGMLKKSKGKVRFEEEILQELHHESIPQFIDKIEDAHFYGYVLEFKEGRTFEDIIYLDKKAFEKDEIYRIAGQLIELLKYLHSKGVVHRDIRVPNTLYNGENVNLVDFGLARWINDRKYKADMDFAFLGDFLLHLYYSSFDYENGKKRPWFDELELSDTERLFLKRLMGVEKRYCRIEEVETDFYKIIGCKP
ncbi:MAG TPA: protein kinase family protein [Pseudobacteroides sp.]|uniref:protein kinase family protein n=1 Tax=Pseudobacteroides sp. TaxID=1968840 RepID=UPI002F93C27C